MTSPRVLLGGDAAESIRSRRACIAAYAAGSVLAELLPAPDWARHRGSVLEAFRSRRIQATALVVAVLSLAGLPVWRPCGASLCSVSAVVRWASENAEFVGADGKVLGYADPRRGRFVRARQVPLVAAAMVAVEDRRFHTRELGIDLRAVARAAVANARALRVVEGGSTIEAQVARTLFPIAWGKKRGGVLRKIAEASLALRLRAQYGPERVLDLYLNHVFLGRGVRGVAAAAQEYWGKEPEDLDLPEIALLAALPALPKWRDPARHPEWALAARNRTLARLGEAGVVTQLAAEDAQAEPLAYRPPSVRAERAALIGRLEADGAACARGRAEGPTVTTPSGRLQALLEDAQLRLESGDRHLAGLALAPDGRVLASVGAVGLAVPAASLDKPFAFALALEQGRIGLAWAPDRLPWPTDGAAWLRALCRDGETPVDLGTALATSRNCEAAKVWALLGEDGRAGFGRFGLAVPPANLANALGLTERPLGELARAYAVFVNRGVLPGISTIPECPVPGRRAVSAPTAAAIRAALEETVRVGTAADAARRWPGRTVRLAAKTGSADRSHQVVLLTDRVVLALRLTDARAAIPGFAAGTVAPAAVDVLRRWLGSRGRPAGTVAGVLTRNGGAR